MAKILIVDDDRDILRLMQFALEKAGYEVLLASDGPHGLEIFETESPDLIIADIMMPEMTGYEFTRKIRVMPNGKDIPLLIYSARFQPIDKQTALEAGATDYIPKNISPADIVSRIDALLNPADLADAEAKNITLAFFSLRGGVGVTSLAVNTAVALALSRQVPVNLTDLNPMAGHAGLMLGLRPKSHIYNVLNSEQPLTEDSLKQHLAPHKSGVQLLASPLMGASRNGNGKVKDIVEQLRTLFTINLIDLSHSMDAGNLSILSAASKIVLVLSPDVPALQSAAAAMQRFNQQGLDPRRIIPVLNRNTPVPGLSAEAIQKTLRRPLAAEIPFEAKMLSAINSGQPLVTFSPQSVATTAIAQLAARLIR